VARVVLSPGARRAAPLARAVRALTPVERTALGSLAARAAAARQPGAALRDPAAARLARQLGVAVDAVPAQRTAVVAWRSARIDEWVRAFLAAHPAGTVVEIGAGVSTRFERLDNGAARWLAIDLPGISALRRSLLAPSPRRANVAASERDAPWLSHIRARGPWCLVLEAMLAYWPRAEGTAQLAAAGRALPGATVILDGPRSWGDAPRELAATLGWTLAEVAVMPGPSPDGPPYRLARLVAPPPARVTAERAPTP
jgi:O-methyltransferase involved in polyketide biosynthesis